MKKSEVFVFAVTIAVVAAGAFFIFKKHAPLPAPPHELGIVLDRRLILGHEDGSETVIENPVKVGEAVSQMIVDGRKGVSWITYQWYMTAIVTKNGVPITTPVRFVGDMRITGDGTELKYRKFDLLKDSGREQSSTIPITDDEIYEILGDGEFKLTGEIQVKGTAEPIPGKILTATAGDKYSVTVDTTEYAMTVAIRRG